ncbi:Nudix hydrolase 2 [Spatholobus suberectus]|nr:Nudix hydrolase 2 [Spatholobus suberectus]
MKNISLDSILFAIFKLRMPFACSRTAQRSLEFGKTHGEARSKKATSLAAWSWWQWFEVKFFIGLLLTFGLESTPYFREVIIFLYQPFPLDHLEIGFSAAPTASTATYQPFIIKASAAAEDPSAIIYLLSVSAFALHFVLLGVQETRDKFRGTVVWKMPTGAVNEGEDVCNAAVRKVKEETGYFFC